MYNCVVETGNVILHYNYSVELHDLLSAMAYALRAEVPLHVIISGSAYSTLFNFVSLLEQVRSFTLRLPGIHRDEVCCPLQAFSGVSPEGVATSLKAVRLKLEARKQTGFITNKEWHRIMDSKVTTTTTTTTHYYRKFLPI